MRIPWFQVRVLVGPSDRVTLIPRSGRHPGFHIANGQEWRGEQIDSCAGLSQGRSTIHRVPPIPPKAVPYSNPLIRRSQHSVHFYESDDELASSVATFFLSGLLGGCGCVAFATSDHGAAIASKLRACGIDIEHAMHSNQLAIIDAQTTLDEICSSGRPDRAVFNRVASEAVQAVSLRHSHILLFGEMVGLLTARGDHQSAILFEEWCNESLLDAANVQMFCAYPKSPEIPRDAYETICCAHTAVL
jgi:hypothetical protein